MSNSRTRYITYEPRLTDLEAYERLPRIIRDQLKEGPQDWDALFFLNRYEKLLRGGVDAHDAQFAIAHLVIDMHHREIMDGKAWRQPRPRARYKHLPPSPHVLAGASMQMST